MINARLMYCRTGNLFKEFVIEENRETVTSTGRAVVSFSGDGINTLKGCLAQTTEQEKGIHSTADHVVTHTIVQPGKPKAKRTDKLIFENRSFYIVDIDDTGTLGISTLYYAEERADMK